MRHVALSRNYLTGEMKIYVDGKWRPPVTVRPPRERSQTICGLAVADGCRLNYLNRNDGRGLCF